MKLPNETYGQYHQRMIDDFKARRRRNSWKENVKKAKERRREYEKSNLGK